MALEGDNPSPATVAAAAAAGARDANELDHEPRMGEAMRHLRALLVPGERLEAVAVQRRVFALAHRRMLVAATSGRFISVARGLLGGYTPQDVRWQDIADARLQVGIFGADLTVSSMTRTDLALAGQVGSSLTVTGLRKEQAEHVYRMCQAQEQAWREKRRVRDLDELRAKAGGIQISGSGPSGVGSDAGGREDPVARLQRAREMLDNRLITDAEYEAIKAKIVNGL